MNNPARIIFMGTPEFAVESLGKLLDAGYDIPAIVTAPDKPAGRGKKIHSSDIKKYAVKAGIPDILQPLKLKDPGFVNTLRSYQADLFVVVAFRMLPEIVWSMPPFGTFNLHASLLPQYRGAAPINWAVMNGESKTGATTFYISKEVDTGHILFQEELPIKETDDAGIVHDLLMELGANLVLKTADAILNNRIEATPQNELHSEVRLKPAPKIHKEDCKIDWTGSLDSIYNKIRGLSPYPTAWTEIIMHNQVLNLKIFASRKIASSHTLVTGTIISDGKNSLKIAVSSGFIEIMELQLAGKTKLKTDDFLHGIRNIDDIRLVV